jgi:hypothetical protein
MRSDGQCVCRRRVSARSHFGGAHLETLYGIRKVLCNAIDGRMHGSRGTPGPCQVSSRPSFRQLSGPGAPLQRRVVQSPCNSLTKGTGLLPVFFLPPSSRSDHTSRLHAPHTEPALQLSSPDDTDCCRRLATPDPICAEQRFAIHRRPRTFTGNPP